MPVGKGSRLTTSPRRALPRSTGACGETKTYDRRILGLVPAASPLTQLGFVIKRLARHFLPGLLLLGSQDGSDLAHGLLVDGGHLLLHLLESVGIAALSPAEEFSNVLAHVVA